MAEIAEGMAAWLRNYVTDGVPASGANKPSKAEGRAIGSLIEAAIGNVNLAALLDVVKDTRAHLNADLTHAADSIALVYADATDANNDLYVKVGGSGSGSWTLTTILHDAIGGAAQPYVDLAQEWAEGAEPGGVGTKSALEWAGEAEALVGSASEALNPSTATSHKGVIALGAGAATFAVDYTWLLFQATKRTTITEIGLRVGAAGSGALSLTVASGDPETGDMTFEWAVALTTVVGTGNKTWANPSATVIEPGQWVGLSFPTGGVQPRTRACGGGRSYYRTSVLTSGTGAFSSSTGLTLEAYFDLDEETYGIEAESLSPELQSLLTTTSAASSSETVVTGFNGSVSVAGGMFATETISYIGTTLYSGYLDAVLLRVATLNSGELGFMVLRGDLTDLPVVVYEADLPAVGSTGGKTFTSAGSDFDPVFLLAGDHVFLKSPNGGVAFSLLPNGLKTVYYCTGGEPYAGQRVVLSSGSGEMQARFTQTVRNLHQPVPATPTMWDIFLTAGQSNMDGQGESGGPAIPAGIGKQYYSAALTEILGDPVGPANTGSMLPAFVNEYYRRTGRGVIIVPASLSGSPLLAASVGGTDNWSSTGVLRGAAITALNAAKAAATSANLAWQFAGVIWCQGERDALAIDASTAGVTAANYKTEFGLLMTYLETQTGNGVGKMPMLILRTGYQNTGDTAGFVAIRGAQDQLARTLPGVLMAHTGAVNFLARGIMKDLYHYQQPALDEMGVSLAMVAASRCVGCA